MLGEISLGDSHGRGELADRHLTIAEGIDNLNPLRIGEGFADLGMESKDTLVHFGEEVPFFRVY
jgi:hypothetical protein